MFASVNVTLRQRIDASGRPLASTDTAWVVAPGLLLGERMNNLTTRIDGTLTAIAKAGRE